MIRKALGVTAVLFILYSILVGIKPQWSASQYDRQDNIIKAQRFIFGDSDTLQDVVVGSSLSCHLVMDSLPGVFNLSFAGMSIFDGLEIIEHRKLPPKRLFIETNVVLKTEDKGFAASLFSPILFYSRKLLPSLRAEKQPVSLFGNFCLQAAKKAKAGRGRSLDSVGPPPSNSRVEERSPGTAADGLFQRMLALQEADYAKDPDPKFLQERFSALREHVSRIERRGVSVVFFEMPVNEHLCGLPAADVVRRSFHGYFPDDKYTYIPSPSCSGYVTTDGVHLRADEAARYTHYFADRKASM